MAGPEKSDTDISETEDTIEQQNGDAPEQVDAEIVETDTSAELGEDVVSAETISADEAVTGAAPEKPSGMSPGTVLLGLGAFVVVGVMLSLGGKESGPSKSELEVSDTPTELAMVEKSAKPTPSLMGSGATLAKPSPAPVVASKTPEVVPTAELPTEPAEEVVETKAESETTPAQTEEPEEVVPEVEQEETEPLEAKQETEQEVEQDESVDAQAGVADVAETQPLEDPVAESETEPALTADELVEQNRRAAIERARARRQARAQAQEDKAREQQEAQAAASASVETPAVETPEAVETSVDAEMAASDEATESEAAAVEQVEVAEAVLVAEPVPVEMAVVTEEKLVNELALLKEDVKADVLAETRAEMKVGQEKLVQLEQRLDKLQSGGVSSVSKQAAISLAVNNLQRQMFDGRPFADEMKTLKTMLPSLRTYELRSYAEKGLPTDSMLRKEYAEVVRKALAATRRGDASGAGAKLGARLSGLFSVRKVGQVEGDSPSAIMSRAESYLEDGNLSQTLRELAALDGAAGEVFADWMADARARMRGEQLIDTVSNRILSELQ